MATRGSTRSRSVSSSTITDWFGSCEGLDVDQRLVTELSIADGVFVAAVMDSSTVTADEVLAAPGIRHFVNLSARHTQVPPSRPGHPETSSPSRGSPVPGW